jgi:drug/metabolite transporter (DMT)-like permease
MTRKVWAAMLAASGGFGSGYVATRSALENGVEPFTLVGARFMVAALVLLAYLASTVGIPRSRRAWQHGGTLGLVYMAAPTIWFTVAFQHVSAGVGGLLIATIPLATAAWAHFLLADERLNRVKVAGLVVALLGMAVMVLSGDSGIAEDGDPVLGAGFVLVGVTAASLGYVYSRRFLAGTRPSELAGPQFVVAALTALVIAIAFEGSALADGLAGSWFEIGYLALAATVVPFVLLLWVIRSAGATRASLLEYLVPIVGVLVGWLVLGERITGPIIGGGLLILFGVWVTTSPAARRAGGPATLRDSRTPLSQEVET